MGTEDILSRIDVGFILAIILVMETVKQVLKRVAKKEAPVWVWKVAVLGCGLVASLLAEPVTWRVFVKGIFLYAAGATIIYQTAKPLVYKVVDQFFPKEGDNADSQSTGSG